MPAATNTSRTRRPEGNLSMRHVRDVVAWNRDQADACGEDGLSAELAAVLMAVDAYLDLA
jgi:hypothetical protein